MLFIRLYAEIKFTYTLHSSVRKIANALGLKRDKVHRNLKVLVDAGLITVKEIDGINLLTFTLNIDALWELNRADHNGQDIERWMNLHTALERVREAGHMRQDIRQDVRETGQAVANTGPLVQNTGQTVRSSERECDTKKAIDLPKITLDTKESSATVTLTLDQLNWFETIYCQSLIANSGRPRLTETLKGHIITLYPHIRTVEQLNSLYQFTKDQPYLKDKMIKAGNLVYCLSEWQREQQLEATYLAWLNQQSAEKPDDAQPEEPAEQVTELSPPSTPYFVTATISKCSYYRQERDREQENIAYTMQIWQESGLPQIRFREILAQAERETTGPNMDSFFANLARLARVSISESA